MVRTAYLLELTSANTDRLARAPTDPLDVEQLELELRVRLASCLKPRAMLSVTQSQARELFDPKSLLSGQLVCAR